MYFKRFLVIIGGFIIVCLISISFIFPYKQVIAQSNTPFLTLPFTDPDVRVGWVFQDPIHRGIDFYKSLYQDGRYGSGGAVFNIVAAAPGEAYWNENAPNAASGYLGYYVVITHDEKDASGKHYYTIYAHLEENSISSKIPKENNGTVRVNRGEYLGKAGDSGSRSRGVHLHFEVHHGFQETKLDPYDLKSLRDSKYYGKIANTIESGVNGLWITKPGTPILLSPANEMKLNDTSIEFHWQDINQATNYALQINRISDGQVVFQRSIGNNTTYNYVNFPADGAIYAWRVIAGNSAGWGPPSEFHYFANGPLPSPQLVTPANKANFTANIAAFRWNPVAGATHYRFLLKRADNGEIIVNENIGNQISYPQKGLAGNGTEYLWQVAAGNRISGWGSVSEERAFTIGKSSVLPPGYINPSHTNVPILKFPADKSVVDGSDVTFEWSQVRGATSYNLYLQKIGEPNTTRETIKNSTLYYYNNLAGDGSTYRWKVEARIWWLWLRSSEIWEFISKDDDTEKRNKELNVCDVWTAANSGGYGTTVDRWDISELPAGTQFDIKFNTFQIPDKIIIEYQGVTVYDSGWRGQQSYVDNNPHLYPGGLAGSGRDELEGIFTKGTDNSFILTVYGPESRTEWNYQMRARCR